MRARLDGDEMRVYQTAKAARMPVWSGFANVLSSEGGVVDGDQHGEKGHYRLQRSSQGVRSGRDELDRPGESDVFG